MTCSVQNKVPQMPYNLCYGTTLKIEVSSNYHKAYKLQIKPQQPALPVSTLTSNIRLSMMNQNPKDLHTARLLIEELRAKVVCQTEQIMEWRKAYALQIQQHYRYQQEKTEQMNALTSQLLLLESRLKRKQKQIGNLLIHRELTIQRQQKIINTLSSRLMDNGLEPIDMNTITDVECVNDSDSAVVLEEIDADSSMMLGIPYGSGNGDANVLNATTGRGDGVNLVRSISEAIERSLIKYGSTGSRRNNCYLRRPEILETVYSVEEDPEPTSDVADKRDKFKNRSDKALSSSIECQSSEGNVASDQIPSELGNGSGKTICRDSQRNSPKLIQFDDCCATYSVVVPQFFGKSTSSNTTDMQICGDEKDDGRAKSHMNNLKGLMNSKSLTKYQRISKGKSRSLEELRGCLKDLLERNASIDLNRQSYA